jgi:hypothetical protein
VSVPLLPARERSQANGASPTIIHCSEWCDGSLDREGWRGQAGLGLAVERIPSASPMLDRLSGFKKSSNA